MAKINFKLNAIRSVTVRALNGKLYNLKSGVNSFELEYNDYAALLKALGMKPKPEKKDVKQSSVSDSRELKDNESIVAEESVSDTHKTQSDESEVSSDERTDESEVSSDEQEVQEDEPLDERDNVLETSHESETLCNEQEVKEDSKEADYASMSYTKLKAEYKRITGKQCKLKKDELIKFLQEHRDA